MLPCVFAPILIQWLCRDHDYHNFLFSMKASNPLVMVQAYRLLSEEMYLKGWDYPLHLGVTEVTLASHLLPSLHTHITEGVWHFAVHPLEGTCLLSQWPAS